MLKKPSLGRITQGTIFCGGVAEDYPVSPVWGLIITARCDTTHEKVPVVNYLPVVRVEDWCEHHGAFILADRVRADLYNRFKKVLERRDLSESLLQVQTYSKIVELNFPRHDPAKNKKEEAENRDTDTAASLAAQLRAAEDILASSVTTLQKVSAICEAGRSHSQKLFQDLIAGQLAGYYFLPQLPDGTEHASSLGHVVILREIHHLPRNAARDLAGGLDEGMALAVRALRCEPFGLACPIAELVSPWTEHLMQAFCNLFGRIGVTDPDKSRATHFVKTLLPT